MVSHPVRPALPASVTTAVVLLWINVALGAVLLLNSNSSGALLIVAWMVGDAAVAIGLVRRAAFARGVGLALSGGAYVLGLRSGMFISTNLVIFIALLLPGAARAIGQRERSVEG